jgi:hypothetical protein
MSAIRWNVAVSADTDQSVRMFLAAQGSGGEDDLSRFIEEAVRSYLFDRAVEQAAPRLRALYQAGIRSGPSVPMSDDDWAALRDNAPP